MARNGENLNGSEWGQAARIREYRKELQRLHKTSIFVDKLITAHLFSEISVPRCRFILQPISYTLIILSNFHLQFALQHQIIPIYVEVKGT
jgi:hypothetical protein